MDKLYVNLLAAWFVLTLVYFILKLFKVKYKLPHKRLPHDEEYDLRKRIINRIYQQEISQYSEWLGKGGWYYENNMWVKGEKKVPSDKMQDEYLRVH